MLAPFPVSGRRDFIWPLHSIEEMIFSLGKETQTPLRIKFYRAFSMEDSEFRTLHLRSKHTSSELSLVTFCMEIAPCIFFPSDNAVNGNG